MIGMHSLDEALLQGIQFSHFYVISSDIREFLGAGRPGFLGYQGHRWYRRQGLEKSS